MVLEPLQDNLLGEVRIFLPVFEPTVQRHKDGAITAFGRVQVVHDLVVLVNDVREDLGVFVTRDELIDGLGWGMTMTMTMT